MAKKQVTQEWCPENGTELWRCDGHDNNGRCTGQHQMKTFDLAGPSTTRPMVQDVIKERDDYFKKLMGLRQILSEALDETAKHSSPETKRLYAILSRGRQYW